MLRKFTLIGLIFFYSSATLANNVTDDIDLALDYLDKAKVVLLERDLMTESFTTTFDDMVTGLKLLKSLVRVQDDEEEDENAFENDPPLIDQEEVLTALEAVNLSTFILELNKILKIDGKFNGIEFRCDAIVFTENSDTRQLEEPVWIKLEYAGIKGSEDIFTAEVIKL
jgi:hypothetical protein